jgi:DNA repair exonuclease SbcCD ATPase subunit
MQKTLPLAEQIASLESEIAELSKDLELLNLNLPSGVAVSGGSSFYEELRSRLDAPKQREEALKVLNEAQRELTSRERKLKELRQQHDREQLRESLAPRVAELHAEIARVDAIALQLSQDCSKLAEMDAGILRDFPHLRGGGWSGTKPLSIPISEYRNHMITVVHGGGGAQIKPRS